MIKPVFFRCRSNKLEIDIVVNNDVVLPSAFVTCIVMDLDKLLDHEHVNFDLTTNSEWGHNFQFMFPDFLFAANNKKQNKI